MRCQFKENPTSNICGIEYIRKGSSTGNAILHLRARHNITQSGKVSMNQFALYYIIYAFF